MLQKVGSLTVSPSVENQLETINLGPLGWLTDVQFSPKICMAWAHANPGVSNESLCNT